MAEIVNKNYPSVTVVMPAYNAARYLKLAIESILDQSYTDFILLVINDGSSDDTEKIILSFEDKRIRYIKNEVNIGLVATLNKGIDLTETEFFARMDADDIALPDRLKMQMDFLNTHPGIGVCGTKFERFGSETGIPALFSENDAIVANLIFSNGICHPSVIIRTAILKKNNIRFGVDFDYNDGFGHRLLELEDYALWHKLKRVTKFSNLDTVLLRYRREGQNLSTQNMEAILKRRLKFVSFWLNELGILADKRALELHCSYHAIKNSTSAEDVFVLKKHFDSILAANELKGIYPKEALKKAVNAQWERFFYFLPAKNWKYFFAYWKASGGRRSGQLMYALKASLRRH